MLETHKMILHLTNLQIIENYLKTKEVPAMIKIWAHYCTIHVVSGYLFDITPKVTIMSCMMDLLTTKYLYNKTERKLIV